MSTPIDLARFWQALQGKYWAHPGNVPGMTTVNGVSADGRRVVVLSLDTTLADPTPVYQRTNQVVDDTLCS